MKLSNKITWILLTFGTLLIPTYIIYTIFMVTGFLTLGEGIGMILMYTCGIIFGFKLGKNERIEQVDRTSNNYF